MAKIVLPMVLPGFTLFLTKVIKIVLPHIKSSVGEYSIALYTKFLLAFKILSDLHNHVHKGFMTLKSTDFFILRNTQLTYRK